MNKADKAKAYDAQNLVAKFNQLYPVGSTVLLRRVASPKCPYGEYKVRKEAFTTPAHNAVAFFEGIGGYFSIESIFVKYP